MKSELKTFSVRVSVNSQIGIYEFISKSDFSFQPGGCARGPNFLSQEFWDERWWGVMGSKGGTARAGPVCSPGSRERREAWGGKPNGKESERTRKRKREGAQQLEGRKREVREAWKREKVELENQTAFRTVAREGGSFGEVQRLAKSSFSLSRWSKSWPHQLVRNLITWEQLFCSSAWGPESGEERSLEPGGRGGVRKYGQKARAE